MEYSAEKLEKLVKDLVRLGDYSRWEPPKQPENISWFNQQGNYQDGNICAKRLEELALLGANLKDKAYLISNVNRSELLDVALKYGADPNLPGKSGGLTIDRALARGRTDIAQSLINHPEFNFVSDTHTNALFLSLDNGRYKLAQDILEKKPELFFTKDKSENTPLIVLAQHLAKGNKFNSKAIKFVKACLDYADKLGVYIDLHESNKAGQNISHFSLEMSTMITEKYALDLNSKLSKKDNQTSRNLKI